MRSHPLQTIAKWHLMVGAGEPSPISEIVSTGALDVIKKRRQSDKIGNG